MRRGMFFSLSKILWAIFNPGAVLVIVIGLGTAALLTPWRALRRIGRGLLVAGASALVAIAVLPVGYWLLAPLEARFAPPDTLPEQVSGVIVLGGAIDLKTSVGRGRAQLNEHAERMIAFADLARRYPRARLVFTGGSGLLEEQTDRESDFVPEILRAMGVDPARVMLEREARNTRENAARAKAMLAPAPGEIWILITSAAHMPRAVGVFRALGWPVLPYPVDYVTTPSGGGPGFELTRSLRAVSLGVHEWLGLFAYRLAGYTDEVVPGPQTPDGQGRG
ncbi:MAG: YdcF family protein [Alphaproteobacteria bacterium]|nr:MAG: YdcF family protein [Alphaproteobacteria bacterium]